MTQREFECALARATGETRSTLRQRGFTILYPPEPAPLSVDWDMLDAERVALFPDYQSRHQ